MNTLTRLGLSALTAAALVAGPVLGFTGAANAAEQGSYSASVIAANSSTVTLDVKTTGTVRLTAGGSTGAHITDAEGTTAELPRVVTLEDGSKIAGTWTVDGTQAVFHYAPALRNAYTSCVATSGIGGAAAGAAVGALFGPGFAVGGLGGALGGAISGAFTCKH